MRFEMPRVMGSFSDGGKLDSTSQRRAATLSRRCARPRVRSRPMDHASPWARKESQEWRRPVGLAAGLVRLAPDTLEEALDLGGGEGRGCAPWRCSAAWRAVAAIGTG